MDENDKQSSKTPEIIENASQETPREHSLEGMTLFFLGSSVTYGSAAGGRSFVDIIENNNACTCIKEAVSGTTLADGGQDSYVQRLIRSSRRYDAVDHFICQLSTNDASQGKPLGKVSGSKDPESFDTSTVTGAMEYIIAFVKDKWNCPVTFYTGTYYDSSNYQKMVDVLYELQEKWGIGIIDMWNDEDMRNIDKELYNKYMDDEIHPTALGYEEWWTPVIEKYLKTH